MSDNATVKRPTTCGALYVTNPELGSKGCKRLPRHGGDHRATLTLAASRKAAVVKAAPKSVKRADNRKATVASIKACVKAAKTQTGHTRGRLSVTGRREVIAAITAMLDAGTISTSIALGAVVAL